jgi:hypothetical protein
MVETIQSNGMWHITLAMRDLVEQGGLDKVDLTYEITHLEYKGRKMVISHIPKEHLAVSLEGERDEDLKSVMGAFSKVVGYNPFCNYNLHLGVSMIPTYEWDRINPENRMRELKSRPDITSLVRI